MTRNKLIELIALAYQHCADGEIRQPDHTNAAFMAGGLVDSACQNGEFHAALEERLLLSATHMLTRPLAMEAWKVLLLLYALETELDRLQPERGLIAQLIKKIRRALCDPFALAVWPYSQIGFTHSEFADAKTPLIQRTDLLEKFWPVEYYLLDLVARGVPLDRAEAPPEWRFNLPLLEER